MKKVNVCVLFGGISPEHTLSLRSAEAVLTNLDPEKYNIFPVGITKSGDWILYGGNDYSRIPSEEWLGNPDNRKAAISPIRGQGLLSFEGDCVVREMIDVVFPVIHGINGEDGAIQGLLQLADIPYVGSHLTASAVAMDKALTKLIMDDAGIPQSAWCLEHRDKLSQHLEETVEDVELHLRYPVAVKPAGTGILSGVSEASDRTELAAALQFAGEFDERILIEEVFSGTEIIVAVIGNTSPAASVCGEIVSGADYYDYSEEFITDMTKSYIPARIPEHLAERIRDLAVKAYSAIGGCGLCRVDFLVDQAEERVVFRGISMSPGFSATAMYPKLFDASGIPFGELVDQLVDLALEAKE